MSGSVTRFPAGERGAKIVIAGSAGRYFVEVLPPKLRPGGKAARCLTHAAARLEAGGLAILLKATVTDVSDRGPLAGGQPT